MGSAVENEAPTVHIVVTCTNRKRVRVPSHLQVRDLQKSDVARRSRAWIKRLSDAPTVALAKELYAGEHWQIARGLAERVGAHGRLWVSSAGYGLISADAPLAPYGATFALGQDDSVADDLVGVRAWWEGLAQWEGPEPGQPRSISALAAREPDSVIIAVLSDPYVRACALDLRDAEKQLSDADSLSVVGPAGRCHEVDDMVVPVTAALRSAVGGSLLSLNVRAAADVIDACQRVGDPLKRPFLKKLMQSAHEAAPVIEARPAGARLTDDQVRDFIFKHVAFGPTSATKLLRALRDAGLSCEQSRFRQLFLDVTASRSAGSGGLF
ncbi:hypothetical protein GCM10010439_70120 [Actinocorallia aurantiaca]|uniref:Uncharacterized protein n=1 Tax=Actinocorallia aurantiaca TaxID=46204 RepID=A0ABN3USH9_9ACTN